MQSALVESLEVEVIPDPRNCPDELFISQWRIKRKQVFSLTEGEIFV